MPEWSARAVAVALVTSFAVVLTGGAALADPAVPTHYRSTVTAVEHADGEPIDLDVEVLGGDAFLVVTVPGGRELQVPGYDGEPYVRVLADGTVEVNQRSPARWLNDARFGAAGTEVPASADADAPPDWQVQTRSGAYAWHDHRIHFMAPSLPAQVDPDRDEVQQVWEWEVPVVLDGEPAVIRGDLEWVPGTGVAVTLAGFVLALAAAVLLVRRREGWGQGLLGLAGVLGLVLGVATNVGLPPGAEGQPALVVLPAVSLVALVGGWLLLRRDDRRGAWLVGLAAVPALVVSLLMLRALTRPIVPGMLPSEVVRALVVLIAAGALAGLIRTLGRVWAFTSLDAEDAGSTAPS